MKIDRLVSIIMILLEKERIGAQELADMFEVSPRTIYRDIDAINLAGIPISSTSGVGGGFEIMQNYKVDKKIFSTTDLSAILMGLSSVSNIVHEDDLINALAKIKSFIPKDKVKALEIKMNQIQIDLDPWICNEYLQQNLEIIKTALQENKLLSFEYINHSGTKTQRTVEPYQLILKNSHWYCQCYCYNRKEFRIFKLSRISNLQILEKVFTPRSFQKPQLAFTEKLETIQTKIKIRIHKSIMERVLDFCPYEKFSSDGDEYFFVDFPFIENDFCYDILLSFGSKCECIEPKHVREKLKQKIQDMMAIYKCIIAHDEVLAQ